MQTSWVNRAVRFLAGQTISLFGSSVVQLAINWHITLTTQSGLMMTIATVCGFLPQVLISLFAGVWADRHNRKTLIILADSMIAVGTAALAVLFAIGYQELWLLFSISAVRSLGAGIQSPAVGAFLPEFVPEKRLMRVNGINSSIQSVMTMLSPAIAGWLYGSYGLNPVFWVDVGTAAIGISLLLTLKTLPREKPTKEPENILKEMFGGVRYVMQTRWMRQFLGFYLFYALMFGPVVLLTPLMVARSFGPETWRLQLHEMVFSIGMILGGLTASIWGGFKNKVHTLIGAAIVFGLATFVMGFSRNFWFYLAVMLPMGIVMPFINTSSMTIMQTTVQPEMMGRVFALTSIIGSSAMPLSMVFFGPLADVVSVELQLIITGALMLATALSALRMKEMMALGKPAPAAIPGDKA